MTCLNILLADNDPDFLATRGEFLENEGYCVHTAPTPAEAQRILKQTTIDLAVIDLRLENDDDDCDRSGLQLARAMGAAVPKIILTGFANYEVVREMLRPGAGGIGVAADFVAKHEGPQAMIAAIGQALRRRSVKATAIPSAEPPRVILNVTAQLEKDYEEVRREMFVLHRARLGLIVFGLLVLFLGMVFALLGKTPLSVLSAVAGIVTEALAALLTRFAADTSRRMDLYHRELLGLYHKEQRLKPAHK